MHIFWKRNIRHIPLASDSIWVSSCYSVHRSNMACAQHGAKRFAYCRPFWTNSKRLCFPKRQPCGYGFPAKRFDMNPFANLLNVHWWLQRESITSGQMCANGFPGGLDTCFGSRAFFVFCSADWDTLGPGMRIVARSRSWQVFLAPRDYVDPLRKIKWTECDVLSFVRISTFPARRQVVLNKVKHLYSEFSFVTILNSRVDETYAT